MIGEPWFWRDKSSVARALSASLLPGAFLYDGIRRIRNASISPSPAPVPVFCVGNATMGGVGKTPFAIMLHQALKDEGIDAHFLTRGYGGVAKGPLLVDAGKHRAADVGDEALLLARCGPAWVSRNRPQGAQAAAAAGAGAVIMDDGYQNPSLEKTVSILLASSDDPFGNNHIFPAGPLREPTASALERADATATVFPNRGAAMDAGPAPTSGRLSLKVWLEPAADIPRVRLYAFCGIGRPDRFFEMLRENGADLAGQTAFPDHHVYSAAEISHLRAEASAKAATLISTEKDFVRLRTDLRESVLMFPVRMQSDRAEDLKALALGAVATFQEPRKAP